MNKRNTINHPAAFYVKMPDVPFVLTLILVIPAFLLTGSICFGQTKTITGRVLDSTTHAALQNVSITIANTDHGKFTDSTGRFKLTVDKGATQLIFSIIGYTPKTVTISENTNQRYTILLAETYSNLQSITIKQQKRRYRNKDNPAVELIREVIRHKPENEITAYPYATWNKYDKSVLLMDNLPRKIMDGRVLGKYHFLFENADSTKVPGKKLIPLYITEVASTEYYRQHPEKSKSIILGQKSVDYGQYIDMKGISALLKVFYGDIDLYSDKVDLFGTQLLSPLSDAAPTFYKFYIEDTTIINGVPTVKMTFLPRNPDDLLFRGDLFIPLDGHYAVLKADLSITRHINLNFVRSLNITIDFKKDSLQHYFFSSSDMLVDLGLFEKTLGMFAERLISNTGFQTGLNAPDSVFKGLNEDSALLASNPSDTLWNKARSIPLTASEAKTYRNVDSLSHMRSYKTLMEIGTVLTVGYKQFGGFNLGPVFTFASYNPVEGFRAQIGGRTTPKFSKSLYAETFVGYGFKDEQWKYGLNLTYSINHHNIFNYFPLHYLQAGYTTDTRQPGQLTSFQPSNSTLGSFTFGPNDQWLYNNIGHIDYLQEFRSHFSYDIGFQYWQQQPAGSLQYLYKTPGGLYDTVHQITTSSFSATLRWAPHEQFFQNQLGRFDIATHYPIITFNYVLGVKGILNGQYNYNTFHLNIYKRFFEAPFGFTDVTFDAAYITGKLPFPLLYIHPANNTYQYTYNHYNLMNFEEFVSDHYAALNFDHYFNGFFFNKIPWFRWLKLREVVEGKILFGGVRPENDPYKNPGQLRFPTTNGVTSTYVLNGQPYIEGGFGVFNIFKIIRLDFIKRFTYLNDPFINTWEIKFSTLTNF